MQKQRIGHYTIGPLLGTGGMGEVYRAHDSKLGRDVAVKILPPFFTADPERRARFSREARVLATLNHPHIGAIYGLEEAEGMSALILELVEGPTLSQRLQRGPLRIADALMIARQIADALDAAHQKGIVHRDLKPANIVVQGGGSSGDLRAKVLDFGIAKKPAPPNADAATQALAESTSEGLILGTPAYMSPEQARGEEVDKRTDIWAFGCVLFEMLSARRPFEGKSTPDTLAHILEREPDWEALPASVPEKVRALLRRCLVKDPSRRLRDIGDARFELEDAATTERGLRRSALTLRSLAIPILALAAVGTVAAWSWSLLERRRVTSTPGELVEFPILPPEGEIFSGTSPQFAISPDGRQVVFVASAKTGTILWVRSLSNLDARAIPGTEGARNPFWSPDSQSIAYFADSKVKTVRVAGGSPVVVCPVGPTEGATTSTGAWRGNVIIFSTNGLGLRQVPATGGTPTPVTTLDAAGQAHRYPSFLPDGHHFLYLASGSTHELRVGSLSSTGFQTLGTFESHAMFAADHLFFVRGGNLMAQDFDSESRQLRGSPMPVGVRAGVDPPWARGMFSVSERGRIVYRPDARTPSQLTWIDRSGRVLETLGESGVYFNLDLSPDGKRVAVSRLIQPQGSPEQFDIWIMDTATGRLTRLTDDPAWDFDPTWSPDSSRIAFNTNRPHPETSRWSIFSRPSNGTGADVLLVESDVASLVSADWSSTNVIAYNYVTGGLSDIWTKSVPGNRTPTAFLNTKADERHAVFSPDGRWLAFQSNVSGRLEIYVRPFPDREPVHPVSRDGGAYPSWRGDGQEIFFISPDGAMMAASSDTVAGLADAVPRPLFATAIRIGNNHPYAVASDGRRFLIPIPTNPPLRVILDWTATRQ